MIIRFLFFFMIAHLFTFSASYAHKGDYFNQERYRLLLSEASKKGHIPIIIELNLDFQPIKPSHKDQLEKQRRVIQNASDSFLESMAGKELNNVKTYRNLPFVAATVDYEALLAMDGDERIRRIEKDVQAQPQLPVSIEMIGAQAVWEGNNTGKGTVIAVFDTGIDRNHPFFQERVVAEACFSTQNPIIGATTLCPNGSISQVGTGAAADCPGHITGCGHGTSVSGIAAGSGESFSGVAPDADIIAVQVFSELEASKCLGNSPCLTSYASDLNRAIDWLYDQTDEFNIVAANMSFGSGRETSVCDDDIRKFSIDKLVSANIAPVIASGNNGYTYAMNAPACISSAISVGAVETGRFAGTTKDVVASFSNSASFLDLLAPGSRIESAKAGGGFKDSGGTSFAVPHVSGAWAVYRERYPDATVNEVLEAFKNGGIPITDSRNQITTPRFHFAEGMIEGGVPELSLEKEEISVFLGANKSSADKLTLINNGTATLRWSIQVEQIENNETYNKKKPQSNEKKSVNDEIQTGRVLNSLTPPRRRQHSPFSSSISGYSEDGVLYQTHFTTEEGFELGPISGQQGWLQAGKSENTPIISNLNPFSGDQHLLLENDSDYPVNTAIGSKAPFLGNLNDGVLTINFMIHIDASGGSDYQLYAGSESRDTVSAMMTFDHRRSIRIYDGVSLINSGSEWIAGQYHDVSVVVDSYEKSIAYYVDEELIFKAKNTPGVVPEYVAFMHDNYQVDEKASVDRLQIKGQEVKYQWVQVSELSGTVFPDEKHHVELIFHSRGLEAGSYQAQLILTTNDPNQEVSTIPINAVITTSAEKEELIQDYALNQNHPNPFNPTTNISYHLPAESHVTIEIFDLLGRCIQTLVEEKQPAGYHTVPFHASGLSSGIYLYRLETRDFVKTRRMMFLK